MKKIILALFIVSTVSNATVVKEMIDSAKNIVKKHKFSYKIEELKDNRYEVNDYYLSLIDTHKKKIIKKYKLLHNPRPCQDTFNKEENCVKLVYMKSLKYPLILYSSSIGAHSITLDIYNPNINSKNRFSYVGNYGIDYKINNDSITLIYDKTCFGNECPNHQIEFFSPFYKQQNAFYFNKNSSYLSIYMRKRVKHLAEFFNEYVAGFINYETNEEKKIRLIGYTDQKGTQEYNYHIGLNRAKLIKDLLLSYGVDKNSIIISSKGELNPICKSNTERCYKQNRRVEFSIW